MIIKLDKAYSGEKIIEAACNLCSALEGFFPNTKWEYRKSSYVYSATIRAKPLEIRKIERTDVHLSVKLRRRGFLGAMVKKLGSEWRDQFINNYCIDTTYFFPDRPYKKINLFVYKIDELLRWCGMKEFQCPLQTFVEFLAPALLDILHEG